MSSNVRLVSGLVLIVFGLGAFTGLIPLSVLPTPSNVTINCNPWVPNTESFSCSASATVSNPSSSPGTNPFTTWFVVKAPNAQTVAIASQVSTVSAGGSATVNQAFDVNVNTAVGVSGTYTLNVFVDDAAGDLSASASLPFTEQTQMGYPTYWIYYPGGVTLSAISPPGSSVSTCTSSCGVGWDYYKATWASNVTSVSVTATFDATQYSATWCYGTQSSQCPTVTSGQPFTFNPGIGGGSVFIMLNPLINSNPVIFVRAVNQGLGYVASPGSVCLSSIALTFDGVQCGPSGSFTLALPSGAGTNWHWSGNLWSVVNSEGVSAATGNTTSVSLTYAQLQPSAVFSSDVATDQLQIAAASQWPTLTIMASTGGTTTPGPGTYVYKPGTVVSVSLSVQSGYCFNGWIVNGVNQGTANPISITVNGVTAVEPAILQGSGCSPGGGNGNGGGNGGLGFGAGQMVGVVAMLGGAALLITSFGKKGKR